MQLLWQWHSLAQLPLELGIRGAVNQNIRGGVSGVTGDPSCPLQPSLPLERSISCSTVINSSDTAPYGSQMCLARCSAWLHFLKGL